MKKIILRVISILMFMLMVLAIILFIYTLADHGGGGFLDLTNVVQYFIVGIGTVTGVIGAITAYFGWRVKKD